MQTFVFFPSFTLLRLFSLSLKCRYLTLKCSLDCLNCTRLYRSFQPSSSFASSPLLRNHGRETFPTRKNSKFSSSSAFQLTHTGEERKVEEKNGKKFPLSFIVAPSPLQLFADLVVFHSFMWKILLTWLNDFHEVAILGVINHMEKREKEKEKNFTHNNCNSSSWLYFFLIFWEFEDFLFCLRIFSPSS